MKFKKYFFYLIIPSILLIFVSGYIYFNLDLILNLLSFSSTSILLLFILVFFSIITRGLINYLFYFIFSSKLTVIEGIGLAVINSFTNLLPFSGGFFAKGVYLKHQHDIPYSYYLPATTALYVSFISINGLIGLICVGFFALYKGIYLSHWFYLAFLGMFLSILILYFPLNLKILPKKYKSKIENINLGWHCLWKNPIVLLQIVFLQIFAILIVAIRFYVLYNMFSQDILLSHCILISTATILTRLVTLVPGGLGVREGIAASVGAMLGFDFGISALIATGDRLIEVFMTIFFFTSYTFFYLAKTDSKRE